MPYNLVKDQYQKNKIGWKKSFLDSFSQDENGAPLPWMTYPFIEFIEKNLQKHHTIFEFGCGSSTLFFAKRVKKIISLESNAKWLEMMKIKLHELDIKNVELALIEDALSNSDYENFVKNSAQKFDLIIIDSLKRFECVKNSFESLKQCGMLILDDSQRKGYKKIFDFLAQNNFRKQDFFGIAPAQFRLKNTTVFTKI